MAMSSSQPQLYRVDPQDVVQRPHTINCPYSDRTSRLLDDLAATTTQVLHHNLRQSPLVQQDKKSAALINRMSNVSEKMLAQIQALPPSSLCEVGESVEGYTTLMNEVRSAIESGALTRHLVDHFDKRIDQVLAHLQATILETLQRPKSTNSTDSCRHMFKNAHNFVIYGGNFSNKMQIEKVDDVALVSAESLTSEGHPSTLSEIQDDDSIRSSTSPDNTGYRWGLKRFSKGKRLPSQKERESKISLSNFSESFSDTGDKERVQNTDIKLHEDIKIVKHQNRNSLQHRHSHESISTLVGSAYERRINDTDSDFIRPDTGIRLEELRCLMSKDNLDYYVIPSEDAHGSEYVASHDKRRQYISGFTGSAGQAIVSNTAAYLITDSRYWLQARDELDRHWTLVQAGSVGGPRDWIEWLVDRLRKSRIGIDSRMVSLEAAQNLNNKLRLVNSKLVFPAQNLVDMIWKDQPPRLKNEVYIQPIEFSGMDTSLKLTNLRRWIREQPPSGHSYSESKNTSTQQYVGTLVSSLHCIAYLLNLRGSDIPYKPMFHSYLFVGLIGAIIFLDSSQVKIEVAEYLKYHNIQRKEYSDLWIFLRRREWGDGKILISPQTSYAIGLMLTQHRYTVTTSYVEGTMSVKNEVEIHNFRRAYLRDGAAYVRFLAWLEEKLSAGYEITEYEAAFRLAMFRQGSKNYMGLAYENISASGPNAARPHYTPRKQTALMINRDTPYLSDTGGQYRDGTCGTARTMHFGNPTADQRDAFTRVLQGHIAIDSAIFPEGTSGHQLDVLARRSLWEIGLNYLHGTGHGVGSFLTVHEGPHGFSSNVPLVPGNIITNTVGFYRDDKWGMRLQSTLVIQRVKTRGEFNGDNWLGFERLTCVPIQSRMVKANMLTRKEKQWLKKHNQRCLESLAPFLKEDKRALQWLKREAGYGVLLRFLT